MTFTLVNVHNYCNKMSVKLTYVIFLTVTEKVMQIHLINE